MHLYFYVHTKKHITKASPCHSLDWDQPYLLIRQLFEHLNAAMVVINVYSLFDKPGVIPHSLRIHRAVSDYVYAFVYLSHYLVSFKSAQNLSLNVVKSLQN